MALTRAALKEMGVTEREVIDAIMEAHGATVESAKEKAKETAELKAQKTIDELQAKVDSLPKPDPEGKDWRTEYETLSASAVDKSGKTYKELYDGLKGDFDTYKKDVENAKVTESKRSALRTALKSEGANEKLIELLESKFELDKVTLDGDKIKDWGDMVKPIKEQFAEIFGTVQTVGAGVATPPKSEQKNNYTIEQIKKMTPEQINANWETGVKQAIGGNK